MDISSLEILGIYLYETFIHSQNVDMYFINTHRLDSAAVAEHEA